MAVNVMRTFLSRRWCAARSREVREGAGQPCRSFRKRLRRAAALLVCLASPSGCQSASCPQGIDLGSPHGDAPCRVVAGAGIEARSASERTQARSTSKGTDRVPRAGASGSNPPALPAGVAVVKIGPPVLQGIARVSVRNSEARPSVPAAILLRTSGLPAEKPVEPPAPESCVDLVGALNLAGAGNPTIFRALEVVRGAQGELLGAGP